MIENIGKNINLDNEDVHTCFSTNSGRKVINYLINTYFFKEKIGSKLSTEIILNKGSCDIINHIIFMYNKGKPK
jgi:hypothetical protein